MDPYIKIIRKRDLYNATKNELAELESSQDSVVRREGKTIFRPIFDDIQRARKEAKIFDGNITIRIANENDFDGLRRLSKRVTRAGNNTGIRSFNEADLRATISGGIMFVATTGSGFIIGCSSMLIQDGEGVKFGDGAITMVSLLFRRKRVAERLFNIRIDWAKDRDFTEIITRGLSESGYQFLKAMERKRKDLKFCISEWRDISRIILKQ